MNEQQQLLFNQYKAINPTITEELFISSMNNIGDDYLNFVVDSVKKKENPNQVTVPIPSEVDTNTLPIGMTTTQNDQSFLVLDTSVQTPSMDLPSTETVSSGTESSKQDSLTETTTLPVTSGGEIPVIKDYGFYKEKLTGLDSEIKNFEASPLFTQIKSLNDIFNSIDSEYKTITESKEYQSIISELNDINSRYPDGNLPEADYNRYNQLTSSPLIQRLNSLKTEFDNVQLQHDNISNTDDFKKYKSNVNDYNSTVNSSEYISSVDIFNKKLAEERKQKESEVNGVAGFFEEVMNEVAMNEEEMPKNPIKKDGKGREFLQTNIGDKEGTISSVPMDRLDIIGTDDAGNYYFSPKNNPDVELVFKDGKLQNTKIDIVNNVEQPPKIYGRDFKITPNGTLYDSSVFSDEEKVIYDTSPKMLSTIPYYEVGRQFFYSDGVTVTGRSRFRNEKEFNDYYLNNPNYKVVTENGKPVEDEFGSYKFELVSEEEKNRINKEITKVNNEIERQNKLNGFAPEDARYRETQSQWKLEESARISQEVYDAQVKEFGKETVDSYGGLMTEQEQENERFINLADSYMSRAGNDRVLAERLAQQHLDEVRNDKLREGSNIVKFIMDIADQSDKGEYRSTLVKNSEDHEFTASERQQWQIISGQDDFIDFMNEIGFEMFGRPNEGLEINSATTFLRKRIADTYMAWKMNKLEEYNSALKDLRGNRLLNEVKGAIAKDDLKSINASREKYNPISAHFQSAQQKGQMIAEMKQNMDAGFDIEYRREKEAIKEYEGYENNRAVDVAVVSLKNIANGVINFIGDVTGGLMTPFGINEKVGKYINAYDASTKDPFRVINQGTFENYKVYRDKNGNDYKLIGGRVYNLDKNGDITYNEELTYNQGELSRFKKIDEGQDFNLAGTARMISNQLPMMMFASVGSGALASRVVGKVGTMRYARNVVHARKIFGANSIIAKNMNLYNSVSGAFSSAIWGEMVSKQNFVQGQNSGLTNKQAYWYGLFQTLGTMGLIHVSPDAKFFNNYKAVSKEAFALASKNKWTEFGLKASDMLKVIASNVRSEEAQENLEQAYSSMINVFTNALLNSDKLEGFTYDQFAKTTRDTAILTSFIGAGNAIMRSRGSNIQIEIDGLSKMQQYIIATQMPDLNNSLDELSSTSVFGITDNEINKTKDAIRKTKKYTDQIPDNVSITIAEAESVVLSMEKIDKLKKQLDGSQYDGVKKDLQKQIDVENSNIEKIFDTGRKRKVESDAKNNAETETAQPAPQQEGVQVETTVTEVEPEQATGTGATAESGVNKQESYKIAGEKSKQDKNPNVIGDFLLKNGEVGDTITDKNGDGYEITEVKTRKDGTKELVIVPFELINGEKDYNYSSVKLITERNKKDASGLYEFSYTDNKGDRVTETYNYNTKNENTQEPQQQQQLVTPATSQQAGTETNEDGQDNQAAEGQSTQAAKRINEIVDLENFTDDTEITPEQEKDITNIVNSLQDTEEETDVQQTEAFNDTEQAEALNTPAPAPKKKPKAKATPKPKATPKKATSTPQGSTKIATGHYRDNESGRELKMNKNGEYEVINQNGTVEYTADTLAKANAWVKADNAKPKIIPTQKPSVKPKIGKVATTPSKANAMRKSVPFFTQASMNGRLKNVEGTMSANDNRAYTTFNDVKNAHSNFKDLRFKDSEGNVVTGRPMKESSSVAVGTRTFSGKNYLFVGMRGKDASNNKDGGVSIMLEVNDNIDLGKVEQLFDYQFDANSPISDASAKKFTDFVLETLGKDAEPTVKFSIRRRPKVEAKVNIAPLYKTNVNTIEEANEIFKLPFYKKYKEKVAEVAEMFNVKIKNSVDSLGGFAGKNEVTTYWTVEGDFNDIQNFAAVMGALAPEVQESTIAGMFVEDGSENHNANHFTIVVNNPKLAQQALNEAGLIEDGYTIEGNNVHIFDIIGYTDSAELDKKIDKFEEIFENNGGQITEHKREPARSEYIDYEKRAQIIGNIKESPSYTRQGGARFRNIIDEAAKRNDAFKEFHESTEGNERKRLTELRAKQIDNKPLTSDEVKEIKSLEKLLAKPLELFFEADQKRYEQAKAEIEAIADEIVKLTRKTLLRPFRKRAFYSPFPTKNPQRAAIKAVRWYASQANSLGDGARTNVIVGSERDADFLFEEIQRRFATTLDRSEFTPKGTELGYPKRLIEVRTPSGKLAEIQIMTPRGYLAKDGSRYFPDNRIEAAKKEIRKVQKRIGFAIPDGVGHYFYELHRDPNVPKDIRDEAQRLSVMYYDVFMNEDSTVTEEQLMIPLMALRDKVDAADKSEWDDNNKAEAPLTLVEYINNQVDESYADENHTPLSKNGFDTLIEKLKKPFAKAFKNLNVTTDWEAFSAQAKKAGVSDVDIQRMVMAFHGSPHRFDRFSTEFMGSGEGAQAFGWGLYFTDLESIARNYAEKLAKPKLIKIKSGEVSIESIKQKFNWKDYEDGDIDRVLSLYFEGRKDVFKDTRGEQKARNIVKYLDSVGAVNYIYNRNIYTVSLHEGKTPEQYTWLEWDKPIDKKLLGDRFVGKLTDEQIEIVIGHIGVKNQTNENLYEGLSKALGSPKAASLFLLENGIDGIKYPAESISRGATSDTARGFNYVVFDDQAVTIVDKVQFMHTANGDVYGAKLPDGTIYINPERLNANTAFHEFSHLWEQLMPNAWKKGLEIFKQTATGKRLFNELKSEGNYANLSDQQIWSEAMNTHIGNIGDARYKNPRGKMKEFVDWFKTTMAKFLNAVGIKNNWTAETKMAEFTNNVLGDLLGEKVLNAEKSPTQRNDVQYSFLSESDFDADGNVKPEVLAEIEAERNAIISEAKANGTWMKAPNGKKTNLNEQQWVDVRTKRFTDWFGDWQNDPENASKVVDGNGEPMVVYHGTPNDGINEFNVENISDITNESAYGFYTTEDKNYGKYYAKEGGVVYDLFLNIRNPFNLGHRDSDKALPTINNLRLITKSRLDKYNSDGFDGVIFKDKSDTLYEIVSFSPNQIKSATSNAGTYSEKSNNIKFSKVSKQSYPPINPKLLLEVIGHLTNGDRKSAVETLQESDYFKTLTVAQQNSFNQRTITSFVKNAWEQVNKKQEEEVEGLKTQFKDKIKDLKYEYKKVREKLDKMENDKQRKAEKVYWRKQATNAIKLLLRNKKLNSKLSHTDVAFLLSEAEKIEKARNIDKAFDKFGEAFDRVIERTERRLNDKKIQDAKESQSYKSIEEEVREKMKTAKYVEEILPDYPIDRHPFVKQAFQKIKDETASEGSSLTRARKLRDEEKKQLRPKVTWRERFKKWRAKISKESFDRQWLAKKYLHEIGASRTESRMVNVAGASARTKMEFERAYDKIYRGLSNKERENLDIMILQKRFIAIDKNREERGLPPIQHEGNTNAIGAQNTLNDLKKEIGAEAFKKLEGRADAYFNEFRAFLDEMLKEELINQEQYDSLIDIDYQPRMFIEHLLDYDGKLSEEEKKILSQSGTLSQDVIKALENGSEGALVSDSALLLASAMSSRYAAIMQNKVNRQFIEKDFPAAKRRYDSIDPVKAAEYEERMLKGKFVAKTKEERFYRYFKELEGQILLQDPESNKYKPAYYYIGGVRQKFWIANDLHTQWHDSIKGRISNEAKAVVGLVSGSNLLKAMATGYNPAFIIVNTPRDFLHTINFSDEYSLFIPKAVYQLGKDSFKALGSIFAHNRGNNTMMTKYIQYGGGMDFLNQQGMLKNNNLFTQAFSDAVDATVSKNAQDVLSKIRYYGIGKFLSNYSEIAFRVALFGRATTNELARVNKEHGTDFKSVEEIDVNTTYTDKNGVETLGSDLKDYIYEYAVSKARGIMDFSQGGITSKDAESVIPYLNAGIQGTRVAAQQFKRNPYNTSLKVLQTVSMGVSAFYGIGMALMWALGDDDDELSVVERYLDFLETLSPTQKQNNFNIPISYDKETNTYVNLSIAKSQAITPFFALVEGIVENGMRMRVGKPTMEWNVIMGNVGDSFSRNVDPIGLSEIITSGEGLKGVPQAMSSVFTRNVLQKGMMTYVTGYDFFFQQPLQDTTRDMPHNLEGLNVDRVEDFYKELGINQGLSPIRTKALVESFVTSPTTNPFVGLIYGGLDWMYGEQDMKDVAKKFLGFDKNGDFKLKKAPIINRALKETTDYNRMLNITKEIKESPEFQLAIEMDWRAKMLSDKIVKEYKTTEEVIKNKDKIKAEIRDLTEDPILLEKIRKRIENKINKPDIDGRVYDIAYSTSSSEKAKAILIKAYFGDVSNKHEIQDQLKSEGVWTDKIKYEYLKLFGKNPKDYLVDSEDE